jgi:hypothetical protein
MHLLKVKRIKQTENNKFYYGLEESQVAYKVEIGEQRKINESNKLSILMDMH